MDRPRIKVDFNEMVEEDLVLLSKTDTVFDSEGNKITLVEGKKVYLYEYNEYDKNEKEYLLAEGVAELNKPDINGVWSKAAKWCCRINENGVQVESTRNT
jgi:hypothetical protein